MILRLRVAEEGSLGGVDVEQEVEAGCAFLKVVQVEDAVWVAQIVPHTITEGVRRLTQFQGDTEAREGSCGESGAWWGGREEGG